jgi:ketosteroid isomerase-like protein
MSNVDRLKVAYQAWNDSRGLDRAAWLSLFADDIHFRSMADGASGLEFTTARKGTASAKEYFDALAKDWEMVYFTADDFISEGDRVVMTGRCSWRHKGTGKTAESPALHVWRFRDGKAIELFEAFDTARAFAATLPD